MRTVRIAQRALLAVPTMIGIAIIVFVFMRLLPGDPVDLMLGQEGNVSRAEMDNLRAQLHLDRPVPIQLALYLGDLARGDLGVSIVRREPVRDMILERFPATIELALGALIFSLVVALPIGIISAIRQRSLIDRLSMASSFLGISMPAFWLGIILILFFGLKWKLLPVGGRIPYGFEPAHLTGLYVLDSILTGNLESLGISVKHLILPSITLGAVMAAIVARVVRSSMLDVMRQDYIQTARAKGLAEYTVIIRHGLRNALIPTVTLIGLELGVLLSGNMIVETVFGWPGIGRLVVDSIFRRDFPTVQGVVIFYAFTFVAVNLLVDVLYTFINPKISL